MNGRKELMNQLLFGVIMITGIGYLGGRYVLRGAPPMKVIAVCMMAGITYFVIDIIRRKNADTQEN